MHTRVPHSQEVRATQASTARQPMGRGPPPVLQCHAAFKKGAIPSPAPARVGLKDPTRSKGSRSPKDKHKWHLKRPNSLPQEVDRADEEGGTAWFDGCGTAVLQGGVLGTGGTGHSHRPEDGHPGAVAPRRLCAEGEGLSALVGRAEGGRQPPGAWLRAGLGNTRMRPCPGHWEIWGGLGRAPGVAATSARPHLLLTVPWHTAGAGGQGPGRKEQPGACPSWPRAARRGSVALCSVRPAPSTDPPPGGTRQVPVR